MKLLPCKNMWGFSTFSFCEALWPKQNYIQFIWGFMEARVQNGVSGGYMHAVFKPSVQQGAEIWTSPPHIFTKGGLLQLPG